MAILISQISGVSPAAASAQSKPRLGSLALRSENPYAYSRFTMLLLAAAMVMAAASLEPPGRGIV